MTGCRLFSVLVAAMVLLTVGCATVSEPGTPRASTGKNKKTSAGLPGKQKGKVSQDALLAQASQLQHQGRYVEAAARYQEAATLIEAALGPNHPRLVEVLNNSAWLYERLGDYAQAQGCSQKALAILEKGQKTQETETLARVLKNLGRLEYRMGDYPQAESHLHRATQIVEAARGPESPLLAGILTDLGNLHRDRNHYSQAEAEYRRALGIFEKKLGPQNPNVAFVLGNWARMQARQGNPGQAVSYLRRSVDILVATAGPDHPQTAQVMNGLGRMYTVTKDYAQAETLMRQALAVFERTQGPGNAYSGTVLNDLAVLRTVQGSNDQALDFFRQAQEIDDRLIDQVLGISSEEEKRKFLATKKNNFQTFLSLIASRLARDPAAVRSGLDAWLRRKGIVLEAQKGFQEAVIGLDQPEVRQAYQELEQARAALSATLFASETEEEKGADRTEATTEAATGKPNPAQIQARIKELETRLVRLSRGYALRKKMEKADTAKVAAALPPGSLLLEIARIRPYRFQDLDYAQPWEPARYLAFVLPAGGPDQVRLRDLGPAAPIDQAVTAFKKKVENPADAVGITAACRRLHDLVLTPLKADLAQARQLFISPDGSLNLVPFEVFLGPEGRFLIEDHGVTYLAAGRDLLAFGQPRTAKPDHPLILGDPDFQLSEDNLLTARNRLGLESEPEESVVDRGAGEIATTRSLKFQPLPGTRAEVQAIGEIMREERAEVHTGAEAQEELLRQRPNPRVLHLATHGFFLDDLPGDTTGGATGRQSARLASLNPLIRSGVALAGANRAAAGQGDTGLLTAEKVLGLKLWGTEMVVLSACETGLGEVESGEGVYGLRRAFSLAGAKGLVMSMWAVPDQETKELMIEFYRRTTSGESNRAEALRQAALREMHIVRERQGDPNPFYWGAFVFLGEP